MVREHLRQEPPALTSPRHTPARPGGIAEAVFSLATIVLAFIGLAGDASRILDSIASITLGMTFLFEGWTLTADTPVCVRDRRLRGQLAAGWIGVVLGILSLLRLAPTVLDPVAVIVFGVGLALGPALGPRLGRVLVGIVAVVLGILALLQLDPRTLTLLSYIGVAGILLPTGPVVAWRLHRPVHRRAAI